MSRVQTGGGLGYQKQPSRLSIRHLDNDTQPCIDSSSAGLSLLHPGSTIKRALYQAITNVRLQHSLFPRLLSCPSSPALLTSWPCATQTVLLEKPFTPANAVPPNPPPPAPPPAAPTTKSESESVAAAARVVFGSRLAGPGERADAKMRETKIVAGVRVPPKPIEPDNCCMSGCVNCVWYIFPFSTSSQVAVVEVEG